MEKVKVTKIELQELNDFRHNRKTLRDFINGSKFYQPLSRFTPEQFSLLLNDWYELEPEFNVGDWAVVTKGESEGVVAKIVNTNSLEKYPFTLDFDNQNESFNSEEIRHATPSEIKQEKERRWWASHSREVNEFKCGDIVLNPVGNAIELKDLTFKKAIDWSSLKLVCPVENRLDVNTNE